MRTNVEFALTPPTATERRFTLDFAQQKIRDSQLLYRKYGLALRWRHIGANGDLGQSISTPDSIIRTKQKNKKLAHTYDHSYKLIRIALALNSGESEKCIDSCISNENEIVLF